MLFNDQARDSINWRTSKNERRFVLDDHRNTPEIVSEMGTGEPRCNEVVGRELAMGSLYRVMWGLAEVALGT